MEEANILQILREGNYLTEVDIAAALEAEKKGHGNALNVLFSNGKVTKDLIGQAIAEHYKMPYADLNSHRPPSELVKRLPEASARKYRLIPYQETKDQLIFATDKPAKGLKTIAKKLGKKRKVIVAYALTEDIEKELLHYRKPLQDRLQLIVKNEERIAPAIVDALFEEAFVLRASDIHMEPQAKGVQVRFRVDGILRIVATLKHQQYESVLNRLKVLSKLRTDQHLNAQDGSIRHHLGDEQIDVRISIVPIFDGEKVVMRILASYTRGFTLSDLGLRLEDQESLLQASKKPFGMILVAGPTGSGKTTSLYGLLKHMNRPEVNIATIEDPVEYKIEGVNHIQVDNDTNLTFAAGLRSIVRQDPDIILVGEIRDQETAEIAVNAALTGHLLLSTFHANDASTAIPRLLDMGIEPFLLASTLEVIIAQRLVRRISENKCRSTVMTQKQIAAISEDAAPYFAKTNNTVYVGHSVDGVEDPDSYEGRTAVFEIIRVTPEMRDLIMQRPTAQQIWQLAESQGAISMYADGIQKVKTGQTTLEELTRVITPPSKLLYAPTKAPNNLKRKAKK